MSQTPIRRDLLLREPRSLKIDPQDILILVVGPPGAGKSNFIKAVTALTGASPTIVVSHELEPSTQTVQIARCTHPDDRGSSPRNVVFVDTPGVYGEGNGWMGVEDKFKKRIDVKKISVTGVLFLHDICDRRPPELSLKEFCGEDISEQTCIVTTHWDMVDQTIGEKREKDINKFSRGMAMARFDITNAHESAWLAVNKLLDSAGAGNGKPIHSHPSRTEYTPTETPQDPLGHNSTLKVDRQDILTPESPVIRSNESVKIAEDMKMPTNEGPPSEDKYLSDSASRSSSEAGQHSDKPYKGEKPPETALAPSVSSPGDVTRSGSAASSELGLLSNGTQPREAAPLEPNEMRPSLEGRLASGVVPVDIHATDLRWDADEEDLDGALHDECGDVPNQYLQENFAHTVLRGVSFPSEPPQDPGVYPPARLMTPPRSQYFSGAQTVMPQAKISRAEKRKWRLFFCCS